MIETRQSIAIDASIDQVWSYVQDIRQWANLFPGCRECTVVDANDSRWVIKVGAGGLVRTVNVHVHVERWSGPGQVDFTYKLQGEPVEGKGTYLAKALDSRQTEMSLTVDVTGSGPMAPMWEAVSRPLLPQLAKTFAVQLKAAIEGVAPAPRPSMLHSIGAWLQRWWQSLFTRTEQIP